MVNFRFIIYLPSSSSFLRPENIINSLPVGCQAKALDLSPIRSKPKEHESYLSLRLLQIPVQFLSSFPPGMAAEHKPTTEDVKMDLFEDDDEFEEFDINQDWDDKVEVKEATQQWEDDWDDDDVNDDFSLQLRRELENNVVKS